MSIALDHVQECKNFANDGAEIFIISAGLSSYITEFVRLELCGLKVVVISNDLAFHNQKCVGAYRGRLLW